MTIEGPALGPFGGNDDREPGLALDKLIFGAFLGISSVAVIEFLQFGKLDFSLTVSLYCFAVAIPILAMGLFTIAVRELHRVNVRRTYPWWANLVETLGIFLSIVGLGGIFWHYHWQAAVAFGTASVLLSLYAWDFHRRNRRY